MLLPDAPFRLSPNPGGSLTAVQVIGRDPLIQRYWEALEGRSLVLAAPRRLGKSSICRRMAEYPPEGWSAHPRNLEGGKSPAQLVRWLYEDVYTILSPWRRTATRAHRLVKLFGGKVEMAGVKLELAETHWADLLDALLDDLEEGGRCSDLLAGFADVEAARDALQRLRQESYIQRTGDTVRFSFGFLRTWWKRERGL